MESKSLWRMKKQKNGRKKKNEIANYNMHVNMIGNWVLAFETVENNQLFSPLCTVCGEKHERQQQN